MTTRPFSTSVALAALVLASVGVAAPSQALGSHELPGGPGTSPNGSAVIDARTVLAAGRITDSNGLPSSGVLVEAYAYPAELPTEVGAEFDLTQIGSAVTDASGNYQIRTNTSALRPVAAEASAAFGSADAAR